MRTVRAQSKCLPPCKNGCRYTRLKFSGKLHGVLDLNFSIYLAGSNNNEVSFHTSVTFSKILCYNDKRCFHKKPGKLDGQAPASCKLTQKDAWTIAVWDIQPQFKALERIRAFETLSRSYSLFVY